MRKIKLLVISLLLVLVTPFEIVAASSGYEVSSNENQNESNAQVSSHELHEEELKDEVANNKDARSKDIGSETDLSNSEESSKTLNEKNVETEITSESESNNEQETDEAKNEENHNSVRPERQSATTNAETLSINSIKKEIKKTNISRLGHLRSGATIYETIGVPTSAIESKDYLNAVYYIKQQAELNGETYYLISTKPSRTDGVIGWVKAKDMSTHPHKTVDKNKKTLYFKGTGKAYSKAWGGSKDLVIEDMSQYAHEEFHVNLTETVGKNTWYRGVLNGQTIWLHSSYVLESINIEKSNISRLGHLRSGATIYKKIGVPSTAISANDYYNAVYYIKQQAKFNGETYYLISTKPSRTDGVIGWVKAKDMSTHPHKTVDKNKKTLYFKGTGKAYSKAWGGSKDLVIEDMSQYANHVFKVNLTETVGKNTWYRGVLNGQTIWLHSSYVTTLEKSNISRLGHLRSGATIYKTIGDPASAISAKDYYNAVYYIKQQAKLSNDTYYLISTKPSRTNGVIGWVKAQDMSTHSHKTVDKKKKVLLVKGTGKAYSKAWGGSKDLVYEDLSNYKDEAFYIDLTETVGKNTWYRGELGNKKVWIHESYLSKSNYKYVNYNLTLAKAVELQMKVAPQTDLGIAYVSKAYIDKNHRVDVSPGSRLNVRKSPGGSIIGSLSRGQKVKILGETNNGWYKIEYGYLGRFSNATKEQVQYYLDPNNFINDPIQQFQFLDLSKPSGATADTLNKLLKGKGILEGMGQAFIDAANKHGINDIYLVSHALLETGNGTSDLATGKIKRNGKSIYNMYGIGAYDSCPLKCGADRAAQEGWYSPEDAIIGGAAFIGNDYIKSGQNTLYKIRWNPQSMVRYGYASHQYASDIGWAAKQVNTMYDLYKLLDQFVLRLEVPQYK